MVVQISDVPGVHTDLLPFTNAAVGDGTEYVAIWRAPFNVNVQNVKVTFTDDVTGQNTNTFHLNLDDDDRSTELGNVDFISDTNATAGSAVSLYAPSSGKSLNANENFYLQREQIGTDMAMPFGTLVVNYHAR